MDKKPNKTKPYVVATSFSRGEQWLGSLLAIRPIRDEVVATKLGDTEATIPEVLEIGADHIAEHGETPIFWAVVRGQLKKATSETPWVVGRLVRVGNAYRLEEVS